jgi:hypothetical protein
MKEIKFKNGKCALVDDEDYEYLSQFKWRCGKYSTRVNWILEGLVKGKPANIRMHREIMGCTDPKLDVDHINHNTLDNRKSNLRVCTRSQNGANRRVMKNKACEYLGVRKRGEKWTAYVKHIYLGQFETKELAALAYNEAATRIHGEFANLNQIAV